MLYVYLLYVCIVVVCIVVVCIVVVCMCVCMLGEHLVQALPFVLPLHSVIKL